MFTLKIENARGEIFELTHDNSNYAVVGVQGLTPPPTAVNTSGAGLIDGTFHNSSIVEQRNIVIDIILQGDIEANRQRLYKIFNIKKPCKIYFANQRRNVQIIGYVETLDGDLFVEREQIQISIICPRPYFEDLNTIYTELSYIERKFKFPFSINVNNPVPISTIAEYPLCTINNGGDVETGCIMTIEITSAVADLTIYNSTLQEFFGFNRSFFAGDTITINTISGQMSVTRTSGGQTTNLINNVKADSTWFKLAVGDNDFTYTVSAGSPSGVRIIFAVANKYGGV